MGEDDYLGLLALASELRINLVVPGPDVSVVEGIEKHFRAGKSFTQSKLYDELTNNSQYSVLCASKGSCPARRFESIRKRFHGPPWHPYS